MECTALLTRALAEVPREARLVKVRDGMVNVVEYRRLMLGDALIGLDSEPTLQQAIAVGLRDGT